jgi:hypothetical protein
MMTPEIEQLKVEIAGLGARIAMAEVQIAAMDDDIPEPALRNAEGGSAICDGTYISTVTPSLYVENGNLYLKLSFTGFTVTNGICEEAEIEDATTHVEGEACP